MAGDGLVLASLLLSAMVTVAQGRLLAGRDPIAVTAVQFLGAALASLPVAAVSEGVPAAPAGAGVVLAVVALALAGTLLPFTLFAFGQSRVSAEVAGAFLNLEPLVGAIAGAVVFGDPVGLVQVAGGAAILAGIALSSLPLLAGRRVARRAAAVEAAGAAAGAGAEAGARAGRASTGVAAGGVGASVGAGHVGAELPRRAKPPSPEPAVVEARVYGWASLPTRSGREGQPLNSGERHGGRNGVFVLARGSKFGAGLGGSVTPGLAHPGSERTRPGGRVAGRPPGRGRGPTAGGGLGGSGRRVTGGRGRSWPGASRGRSAAGR
jgi:EamA-like transporter family